MEVSLSPAAPAKTYWMHEGLLCHHSSYFRGTLRGGFAESIDKVVRLGYTSTDTVDLFKNWIYIGKLFDASTPNPEQSNKFWKLIIETYAFAEMRGIPGLKNACTDAFLDRVGDTWQLPLNHYTMIYERTSQNAALRTLASDLFVTCYPVRGQFKEQGMAWVESLPKDFLVDVILSESHEVVQYQSQLGRSYVKRLPKCRYHDHKPPHERV
jgi:hypothetical protein